MLRKVVSFPAGDQREPADFERATTLEVQRITGELRELGLGLLEIAHEIRCSERQLSAWRSGEAQPKHARVLALRALLEARKATRRAA